MKYVATIPCKSIKEHLLVRLLQQLDLHECYIGREVGARGFKHYQCCIDCAGDLEKFNSEHKLGWHIETCVSWEHSIEYCRKTGNYRYVGNRIEEREFRRIERRPTNIVGKRIQQHLAMQGDRKISICVDTQGGTGKSTYGYLRVRAGDWFFVPRAEKSPTRIMDYITAHYNNQEVIWIDLPRSRVVDIDLAECLEDIKDGLVASAKYEGKQQLIKGVKILVTTNHWVEKKAYNMLTQDRWDIFTALPKH